MKNKILLFILLIIAANLVGGWNGSKSITNHYYYQNKPYFLNINHNKLFIKTKEVLSENNLKGILNQYAQLSSQSNLDKNLKEQFVDLSTSLDDNAMTELVDALNRNGQIEYASAVYSPFDNPKVLQGLENQILVQFKAGTSTTQINNYLNSNGLSIVQSLKLTGGASYVLKITDARDKSSIEIANTVYESGLVNWSEPNFYFSGLLSFIPNDTYFPSQWSIKNTGTNIPGTGIGTAGCDMRVDSAWNITTGISQCVVGMVDTGIDTTHPDISGNMLHGYNYDFINNVPGGIDDHNHGTCTGGIVAATGNNSLGISGVAPGVKLIAIKIFNSAGSTTSTAITNGLLWSWQQGEWISSNSWGGGSPISAADLAIQNGTVSGRGGKGCVFCFATGNFNSALSWPSTNPYVIAVGGNSPCNERKSPTSCDGETFWGANYGTGISIVAPCVKVYATDRQGAVGYDPTDYFSTFNGTSSATPNCAGVCALGLSRDSTMTWDTVRARLCRTADKVGTYSYTSAGPYSALGNTWNNEMGYGKINAYRFVNSLKADLWSQDTPADVGIEPNPDTGPMWISSDIWVRNQQDGFTNLHQHQNPEYRDSVLYPYNPDYVYVMVRNRGSVPGSGQLKVYWAKASTGLSWPTQWVNYHVGLALYGDLIHSSSPIINNLAANDSIVFEIPWFPPNPSDFSSFGADSSHFCLLARIETSPTSPYGMTYPEGTSIGANVNNNNNIVWKNVTVVDNFTGPNSPHAAGWVTIRNIRREAAVTRLRFQIPRTEYRNPFTKYGRIEITLTDKLLSKWMEGGRMGTGIEYAGENTIVITKEDAYIDNIKLDPEEMETIKSTFTINEQPPEGMDQFNFGITQSEMKKSEELLIGGENFSLDTRKKKKGGEEENAPVKEFGISAFPNPFNPVTNINYSLPKSAFVSIRIYDILGQEVTTLVNEYKEAGKYIVRFNGDNLASGVYFYSMEAGDFKQTRKLLLVR